MAKAKSTFVCSNCGATSSVWSGKCFDCGEWGSLDKVADSTLSVAGRKVEGQVLETTVLKDSLIQDEVNRIDTGLEEVNTVLGGGIVQGSVVLLAGQPGVGKSTILMQIAAGVSAQKKVLYVSGEESANQVASRAQRLKLHAQSVELVSTNDTDNIVATIQSNVYDLVIVDSIQTISTRQATGTQGGVSQIVSSAQMLIAAAKSTSTSLLLVGHVTKEGTIAGPKLLEHVVDVVLQLEGEKFAGYKLLRAHKNRYGTIDEVAVMEMQATGLHAVDNPSQALLEERRVTDGSVVFAAVEGNRPLLVEVQALTNSTSFGYPKRTAVGFSQNRLNVLIAVLEKRTKLKLSDTDIYVSVANGLQITDPAADLAVCLAIASSARSMALSADSVVFGEIGLGGEVRKVPHTDKRIKEAQKLGFKTIIGRTDASQLDLRQVLNTYLKKVR